MLELNRTNAVLIGMAALAFLYAVLGNYVALPGYLRFLERGGVSDAGNTLDLAVVIGAGKTIAWMLAFNVGAACLYFAVLRSRCRNHLKHGSAIVIVWLAFWSWPELPTPGGAFFLLLGSLILLAILRSAWIAATRTAFAAGSERRTFYLITAGLFFAFATWDTCGLGSTGRILHPDQVILERSQQLLHTQVVKLMGAFCLAWLFTALSFTPTGREAPA